MKVKTSELKDAALDWAVTVCEEAWTGNSDRFMVIFKHQNETKQGYCWSTNWSQGGPIIEREGINVIQEFGGYEGSFATVKGWCAYRYVRGGTINPQRYYGDTPLIAAMRCYVASKLGDEVDVPEELK